MNTSLLPCPPGPAIRACRAGEGEEEAEAQGQEAGDGDQNTQGTHVLAFTTLHHALLELFISE